MQKMKLAISLFCVVAGGALLPACSGGAPVSDGEVGSDAPADEETAEEGYGLISSELVGESLTVEIYGVAGQPGGSLLLIGDAASVAKGRGLSFAERYTLLTGKTAPVELTGNDNGRPRTMSKVAYTTPGTFNCNEAGDSYWDYAYCHKNRTTDWEPWAKTFSFWAEACKVGSAGTVRWHIKRSGVWIRDVTLSTDQCIDYQDFANFGDRTYRLWMEESNGKFHAKIFGTF